MWSTFTDHLEVLWGAAAALGIVGLIALSLGRPNPAILAAVVLGACVGFLRHNFYPARIFMGDSGALLLGFVLAALSVQGLLKTAAVAPGPAVGRVPAAAAVDEVGAAEAPEVVPAPVAEEPVGAARADDVLERAHAVASPAGRDA